MLGVRSEHEDIWKECIRPCVSSVLIFKITSPDLMQGKENAVFLVLDDVNTRKRMKWDLQIPALP